MRPSQLSAAQMRAPLDPRRSPSSVRRWQARDNLCSQIKDRSTKGPVKWSRSLTEVGITNYKSHCRDFGDRHLFTRRGNLPAALLRKDAKSTESNSTAEEYIYNTDKSAPNVSRRRASVETASEVGSGKECIRHLTIAELHKILGNTGNSDNPKQRHGADEMKIVINSVPSAYPNIKVTFKDPELFHDDIKRGVKLPAVGPVPSGTQKQNLKPAPFQKATVLEPTRRPFNELPLSTRACLAQLEKSRVSSTVWTKRWIEDSPLGPGKNEEYERATDGLLRRPVEQNKLRKSPEDSEAQSLSSSSIATKQSATQSASKTSSITFSKTPEIREPDKQRKQARRVRFGTDQFLLKDTQPDVFQWH